MNCSRVRVTRQVPFHGGFTLMELITVIAIVAILAGLTVAAISSSRRKADSSVCVQNLRQHGLLLNQFLSDFSVFPLQSNPGFKSGLYPEHKQTWLNALFADVALAGYDGEKNSGVFDCPSARRPSDFPRNSAYSDFGYNSSGLVGSPTDRPLGLGGDAKDNEGFGPPVKESEIAQPESMIAFGDGFQSWNGVIADGLAGIGRTFIMSATAGSTQRSFARHGGAANFTMCDGHVERKSLQAMYLGTREDDLQQWNRDGHSHSDRLTGVH